VVTHSMDLRAGSGIVAARGAAALCQAGVGRRFAAP
jgi:hypothetical protein